MQRTNICTNVLQRFARFTKALRWIAAGYICVFCNLETVAMFYMYNHCTTCQLQFVMLCHYFNYTLYIKYLCFRPQSTMDAAHRFLHSTMSTEERRKLSVWIPPLTLPIACNMEHMIAWAPHIHSHGHTFNRPIT